MSDGSMAVLFKMVGLTPKREPGSRILAIDGSGNELTEPQVDDLLWQAAEGRDFPDDLEERVSFDASLAGIFSCRQVFDNFCAVNRGTAPTF